jgi:AmmeMemoRadiSam system protein A
MYSTDIKAHHQPMSSRDRETLLDTAQSSIRLGLVSGDRPVIDPTVISVALRNPQASFVTLHIEDELRGCTGSVEARRPLIVDVADNAFNAAFRDPRFPPLRPFEFPMLTVDISILSMMEPLRFAGEADLLEQIRTGTDGLEIEYGTYRGLLLPSVWELLPDKRQFLRTLKMKAGLPARFWSHRMKVYRFTTESFGHNMTSLPDDSAT